MDKIVARLGNEERKEERLGKRKVETRKEESQCYLLVTVVQNKF